MCVWFTLIITTKLSTFKVTVVNAQETITLETLEIVT